MGQTRQDDTRTELSRPGEPGLTTRMVEKGIQQQQHGLINSGGTWGKWDVCFGCGGVGGEWAAWARVWEGGVMLAYACSATTNW